MDNLICPNCSSVHVMMVSDSQADLGKLECVECSNIFSVGMKGIMESVGQKTSHDMYAILTGIHDRLAKAGKSVLESKEDVDNLLQEITDMAGIASLLDEGVNAQLLEAYQNRMDARTDEEKAKDLEDAKEYAAELKLNPLEEEEIESGEVKVELDPQEVVIFAPDPSDGGPQLEDEELLDTTLESQIPDDLADDLIDALLFGRGN